MNGYYFKYQRLHLARVWADTEEQAKTIALKEHSWCGVTTKHQLTLVRCNSQTDFT